MVIPALPASAPAIVTPTAMPSGILCSVIANSIISVLLIFVCTPSGLSLFKCRCGIRVSNNSKNAIPSKKPTVAGIHAIPPCASVISIDGIRSDQTDAAIITPDAKPSNAFSSFGAIFSFIKNTIAAPSVVPIKGMPRAINIFIYASLFHRYPYYIQNNRNRQQRIKDCTVKTNAILPWGFRYK